MVCDLHDGYCLFVPFFLNRDDYIFNPEIKEIKMEASVIGVFDWYEWLLMAGLAIVVIGLSYSIYQIIRVLKGD